ncbi:unnamed protein product [Nesidiocoris tenuis]|uniref:Uncharacterized protein n=1 Tax=Nesidiocoris tenuis TaxID=355587 RepID=A0A6H5G126_9HEMI|nr:unnamed protein product [Nesidiocoris tenuis]
MSRRSDNSSSSFLGSGLLRRSRLSGRSGRPSGRLSDRTSGEGGGLLSSLRTPLVRFRFLRLRRLSAFLRLATIVGSSNISTSLLPGIDLSDRMRLKNKRKRRRRPAVPRGASSTTGDSSIAQTDEDDNEPAHDQGLQAPWDYREEQG